jgi:hypothetical protein
MAGFILKSNEFHFYALPYMLPILIYVIAMHNLRLVTGRWFSPGTLDSSINKTDRYITEILLKVALNTITLTRII